MNFVGRSDRFFKIENINFVGHHKSRTIWVYINISYFDHLNLITNLYARRLNSINYLYLYVIVYLYLPIFCPMCPNPKPNSLRCHPYSDFSVTFDIILPLILSLSYISVKSLKPYQWWAIRLSLKPCLLAQIGYLRASNIAYVT